jgi:hypothetical protein
MQKHVLLRGRKAREHRQVRNQGTVDRGHFNPQFKCGGTLSAGAAGDNVGATDIDGTRRNVALAQTPARRKRIS